MSMISALIEDLRKDSDLLKDSNLQYLLSYHIKIVKDIQEAIVTIEELGEKVYKANMERSERYYAEIGLTIPENPTNGDMIKALFPKGKIIKFQTFIRYELSDGTCINVNDNWWNAPYKKGEEIE